MPIAIVGMACRYPDASTPLELWDNVLAGRRAFRLMPAERLALADYFSANRDAPDRTYADRAAVIEGYEFDRVRFRVSGREFRSADLAHWLALDVACQALADAGFPDGDGLPRATSGVILGNTLTGELSRAAGLRLRWPYVCRVVSAALVDAGWDARQRQSLLETLEARFKSPFPPITEDTLAGALSNTIAGRICNHLDLKGGGYTVDGACASSLLAVTTGCAGLASGDLDVVVAGGVDLSLDPFELVGFAKTGALAAEDMRVYDTRSDGFWPGEGCGFVVLMRREDADAQKRRIYAVIRGWGVSSDGSGGLTRPELEGQLLAIRRAYARAGYGVDDVGYFEGHGTGTAVGDLTELQALTVARREAASATPASIGSIKANFGHTKAAAGVAGLIKAALALESQVIPPTTGCVEPHPELASPTPALRIRRSGELWPPDVPLRAGVSSMGFGGINTHVTLEAGSDLRRRTLNEHERRCLRAAQDAELLLFAADTPDALVDQIDQVAACATRLSFAELVDLARELRRRLRDAPRRAAVVASTPAELAHRLGTLRSGDWDRLLRSSEYGALVDADGGMFAGVVRRPGRVGYLFPGQASPVYRDGGAWERRFEAVQRLYHAWRVPRADDERSTAIAQPAIALAALAGMRVLDALGFAADVAIGHSLGEFVALCWAEVIDEQAVMRLTTLRGELMATLGEPGGAMASVRDAEHNVRALVAGLPVVVAAVNAPKQVVISGPAPAVEEALRRAAEGAVRAMRLPVSSAFHSPQMRPALLPFARQLADEAMSTPQRLMISTITGAPLVAGDDVRSMLGRQFTEPVRFLTAVQAAAPVDLFVEVGPGTVLTSIVREITDTPCIALDAAGPSLRGLLLAAGAAFVLGARINTEALWSDRFTRGFTLPWQPRFLLNPCEDAPALADQAPEVIPDNTPEPIVESPSNASELIRGLLSERAELPIEGIEGHHRLLSDLHLNSITVTDVIVRATRLLGLPPLASPTEYADATVAEVAQTLEELRRGETAAVNERDAADPAGVDTWVRAFTVDYCERETPSSSASSHRAHGAWQLLAPTGYWLTPALEQALPLASDAANLVVCLPETPDADDASRLVRAAQQMATSARGARFVVVQHGSGGSALAKTLFLEAPWLTVCVVDVPAGDPRCAEWVQREALAAAGYVEVRYEPDGRRTEPVLRLLPYATDGTPVPLGAEDVLMVTGGGKGIAAESAYALARHTGVRVALVGRSAQTDRDVGANVARMRAAGCIVQYFSADITDPQATRRVVSEIGELWGSPTAVLHGAGSNVPCLIPALDDQMLRQALAPKIDGLNHVLAAVDPDRLRLLVAFGSLTARTGMRGDAHYALANEWLARRVERFAHSYPTCRCLTIEWSVWSGIGMGERLGRLEALARQGIAPITPERGVAMLQTLVAEPRAPTTVVVSGRFGSIPTLRLTDHELPFLRFLERPRVWVPGVELVAEAELSATSDPYLMDHSLHGDQLVPGVVALEAMAQVATSLCDNADRWTFENVRFERPVIVPRERATTIRIVGLVRTPGVVDVAIRCEETSFHLDHVHACCRVRGIPSDEPVLDGESVRPADEADVVAIDPAGDLYGTLFFQGGRFRRVKKYRRLLATECVAEIEDGAPQPWFGRTLPEAMVLGDAGMRDAAIHAVQACIPHARLVPVAVERIEVRRPIRTGQCVVRAHETARSGMTFSYELEIESGEGEPLERWSGLRLQQVETLSPPAAWPVALLGPYVERRVQALTSASNVRVIVASANGGTRPESSDQLIKTLLGPHVDVHRRPDGKPEAAPEMGTISVAHGAAVTMVVAGSEGIACDLEVVHPHTADTWRGLLGTDRYALAQLIARETGEGESAAATRVWAAGECAKKAGVGPTGPLQFADASADGWVRLTMGTDLVATFVAPIQGSDGPVTLAVLASPTGTVQEEEQHSDASL